MSLQQQLLDDMKTAMKAGNKLRLETIRGIRAQIKNREIEEKKPLTDEQIIEVLLNAAKKRNESIEQFSSLNRHDRAKEEQLELEVIKEYLPAQMGEEDINALVIQIIQETGASSQKDVGLVMGQIMPKVKGKADGKIIQKIVKEKLSSL